ncbi:MAG: GNAT family protein [Clostridia bacterium]|nr:GNAT family protein [Clostridia bacterium]
MKLETDLLFLRDYVMSDLENFYRLKSCREVWNYSTFIPVFDTATAKNELKNLISKQTADGMGFCALFSKSSGEYIGEAGILSCNTNADRCVIGYNLLPSFWGNGYATDISKRLIKYAFENLNVERVEALAMKNNVASCRVLEKSGLILEGVLKHFTKVRGEYFDVCYYGLTRGDYFEKN